MRLPEYIWKRSVRKQTYHRREEVLPVRSSMGYTGVLPDQDSEWVMIPAVVEEKGLYPVLCRLMAAGCEPVGIIGFLLLPEQMQERELRSRVVALEKECARYRIEIMQLDASFSSAVREPVLEITALGKRKRYKTTGEKKTAHSGQQIVMTGWTGLEGTQQLIREHRDILESRFPLHYIRQAERRLWKRLPAEECRLADEYGISAMQAGGEGGVYDALWQLGEETGLGMEVDLYHIPICQETVEITEFCDRDPYRLAAGGVLLMAADRGEELVQRLAQEQIPAAVIGQLCTGKDRVIQFRDERRFLEPYR